MKNYFDLHTHSSESDGILNPEELVSSAKSAGIEYLALTDHDTVSGIQQAKISGEALGVNVIPAIELSCTWSGVGIHIVGLHIDVHAKSMVNGVAQQKAARAERSELIAARLEKKGIEAPLEGAQRHAGGDLVTRPHFAAYLVEKGYVTSINAAFRRYLGAGKCGDVKQFWPEMDEVVRWILQSGGIPVLAHPKRYKMTNTKRRRLVEVFCDAGGQALEVISGSQTADETRYLADLAEHFGLYASAGSDFHNPEWPWHSLGGFGKLPPQCKMVPLS
ncbi:PHP domain-containing protein [Aurantivibrio plasticivorans]